MPLRDKRLVRVFRLFYGQASLLALLAFTPNLQRPSLESFPFGPALGTPIFLSSGEIGAVLETCLLRPLLTDLYTLA